MPDPRTVVQTLCKLAQSKCIWTLRKSLENLPVKHGKTAADQLEHPDQAPALTLTRTARTHQCGHAVWVKRSPKETNMNV